MAGRGERVHPTHYPEISEPLSPSERSTATGYTGLSSHYNYQPLKAYTTPGYVSPARPPPTVVGRPPREPRKRKNDRKCCKSCLLVSCYFLLLLIFLIGLAALIIWLLYKPKVPKFSVQDVHINKLNVTTTSTSSQPTVDTSILFTILAQNPNHKIKIDYKRVEIETMYDGANVGQTTISGWYQDVQNTTTLHASINASNSPLTASQGSALQASINNNSVPLDAKIDTRVAIKMGAWLTPAVWIHVTCNFQVAPPSAPGGAKLLSKSCKWKWK